MDVAPPYFLFFNKNKTQYLLAIENDKDTKHYYREYQIGYLNDNIENEMKDYAAVIDDEIFVTESKLCLGMSKGDVIKEKGRNYTENGDTLSYILNDWIFKESHFNIRQVPEYRFEFIFKEDRIVQIRYGYPHNTQ